jgi:hypothetical protein
MVLRRVCSMLAAGAAVALSAGRGSADCCNPCAPAPTCKVTVVEYCPEQVPVTRTTYKVECHPETYTAYKCEYVQETRPCTRTVMRQVCETVNVTRTVCVKVPVVETRTCMTTKWTPTLVTEMVSKMVDRGHWECRECPAPPTWRDRLAKLCRKKNDCCDPCPKTVTKRVWVPCMVCETCPVTRCKMVCEQVPHTFTVHTCKTEMRTETVPVTRYRCVAEQVTDNVTVCVAKTVPYTATRMVSKCVPVTETCMVTRMVPRCVEKEVPAQTSCCAASACTTGAYHKAKRAKACCH